MCQDDEAGRALWVGVLAQAIEDLRDEPFGSVDYTAAASFLADDRGEWRRSREDIADLAGVCAERLRRGALAMIEERRVREGVPEGQAVVVRTPPPPAAPKPVEVVTVEQSVRAVFTRPAEPVRPPVRLVPLKPVHGLVRPAHLVEALRRHGERRSGLDNPFNPHRRRA